MKKYYPSGLWREQCDSLEEITELLRDSIESIELLKEQRDGWKEIAMEAVEQCDKAVQIAKKWENRCNMKWSVNNE